MNPNIWFIALPQLELYRRFRAYDTAPTDTIQSIDSAKVLRKGCAG